MKRLVAVAALCAFTPALLYSQCDPKQDHRSNKNAGIFIDQVVLTGTQGFDSSELSGIAAPLVGGCFDENKDELSERIVDQFQQRGYFMAKVDKLTIKALDPLATPKPSKIEAEIIQGPIYRISEVQFVRNRAFTSEELRAKFPIKTGDVANMEKLRSGLRALAELYGSKGYIEYTPIPQLPQPDSNGTVAIKVDIDEGKQYRMGKFEVVGQSRNADILRTRWSMAEGAIYDSSYLGNFVDENKSLLPDGFNQYRSILRSRNCKSQTISLTLVLEDRPDFKPPADKVECEAPARAKPKS